MTEKKNPLEKLKKDYLLIQKEHNLPSFDELNEDFGIEKIAEAQTDYLIREVRKYMADKFSSYIRFIEILLNPVNAPMFIFSVIKSLDNSQKNNLKEVYKTLAKIEVRIIELDLSYDEKKEVEFIIKSYKIWQEIKRDFSEIINSVKKNWDNKFEENGKSYFG